MNLPDRNQKRFQRRIKRAAQVAQTQIEAEGPTTPISDEARLRAENILSYSLAEDEAWGETCALLLAMASKMEMAGHRQKWLEYLERGFVQSQRLGDQPAQAALSFYCGHLQRLMSRYEQAHSLLQSSATLYATLGNQQGEARALNQLAYLAWQQHNYGGAEYFAHQALLLVDDMSLEKAVSLSALGLIATNQGRYKNAENYHQMALAIRTQFLAHKEMAWSLQNLGIALREQGDANRAIEYYKDALVLLDRVYDPANEAITQMNLGTAYYEQGKYQQALEAIDAAQTNLHRISDEYNLAKLLTIRGLCYLGLHQLNAAQHAFQASADLFQQLNDLSWYLNAFDGLGISYLEQEQYEKALTIFESITARLSEIKGTPAYKYLTATIEMQIEQAKSKQVKRGESVYLTPQNHD